MSINRKLWSEAKLGTDHLDPKTTPLTQAIRDTFAPLWRQSIAIGGAALLGILSSGPVSAAGFYWDVATGDWNTASNWDVNAVPIFASGSAYIDNGGTATVTGSVPTFGALSVGHNSSGTLNISGGGSMIVNNNHVAIGYWAGSNGTVLIDGVGSSLTASYGHIILGAFGTGTLTLTNSGQVSPGGGRAIELTSGSSGSGTLNIGNGGAAGIVNGPSVQGGPGVATINFNHTGADYFFTRDGTSAGAGVTITGGSSTSVNLIGTGKTTFVSNNTYAGGTNISNGTLQIGNGGTSGTLGTGNVTNNSALIFNRSDDSSYTGVISGTGTVTKEGAGTHTLSGTNTYTGATTVNAGTLVVNGSIANSATTVNNGGILGGNGTVSDLTLNGGTLAPGNSIGTLNVSGNVDFSSGVYEVEVDDAGNSDKIIATGNADLSGARVSVLPEAGSYAASTDYTILEAASFSNTFTGVSVDDSDFAFLDASLSYSATHVTLSLERNDIDYGDVAQTANQRSVGNTLQRLYDGSASSGMNDLLGEINILSSSAARSAYDQLSGVGHGNSLLMTRQSQQRFGRLLSHQALLRSSHQSLQLTEWLAASPIQLASLTTPAAAQQAVQPAQHHYWITPMYGEGEVDGDGNASGMDYYYAGLSLGFDQQLNQDWLLGAALSYTQSDARFAAGSTDMDGVDLALYSHWDQGVNYLQGYAGVGWYGSDSERRINVGGSQTAESDYHTAAFFGGVEGGHRFMLHTDMLLTPYVGLAYGYSDRESFNESGVGAANLAVASESLESILSTAGVRAERLFNTEQGAAMAWNLNVAWLHEFGDARSQTRAGFVDHSFADFRVTGPDLDRDRVLLGTGLAVAMNGQSTLSLEYNGEFSGSHQDQQVRFGFDHRW